MQIQTDAYIDVEPAREVQHPIGVIVKLDYKHCNIDLRAS
jgi:hypothetical protein